MSQYNPDRITIEIPFPITSAMGAPNISLTDINELNELAEANPDLKKEIMKFWFEPIDLWDYHALELLKYMIRFKEKYPSIKKVEIVKLPHRTRGNYIRCSLLVEQITDIPPHDKWCISVKKDVKKRRQLWFNKGFWRKSCYGKHS